MYYGIWDEQKKNIWDEQKKDCNFGVLVLRCFKANLCKFILVLQYFFEIYKICAILHRSKINSFAN